MNRTLAIATIALAACAASTKHMGAPADPNAASQTRFVYQQTYDGGPSLIIDGGPFQYEDGGPYQPLDAGYFCDGGESSLNPQGCYVLAYDGGPLTLDGGPYVFDAGPFYYDAGIGLPFAILDAGATSVPFWLTERTHLSWIGTVGTLNGQDANGAIQVAVTNDGITWLILDAGLNISQDGGAAASSLTYSIDLVPMDYLGAEIVWSKNSGSQGVLSGGAWYSKQ